MSNQNRKRSWVILEYVEGTEQMIPLAGTEDRKAINAALAAMNLYKQKCIQNGKLDLTLVRQSVVEELSPVNQVLDQDEDDSSERLLSMVNLENVGRK